MLDKILADQQHIQELLGEPMGSISESRIKENLLALIVEATEVLNEIPWKPWKDYKNYLVNIDNLKMETIDCLIFLLNIFNELGMSAEEIHQLVTSKQDNNIKRYAKPREV